MKMKTEVLVSLLVALGLVSFFVVLAISASSQKPNALNVAPVMQVKRVSDVDALNAQYSQEREEARKTLIAVNNQIRPLSDEYIELQSKLIERSYSTVTSDTGRTFYVETVTVNAEIQSRMNLIESQLEVLNEIKRQSQYTLTQNRVAR